jgi:hypothetical protein
VDSWKSWWKSSSCRSVHDRLAALGKYLDPQLPLLALRIFGVGILVQSADAVLQQLAEEQWAAFRVEASSLKHVQAVFRFHDAAAGALQRLKRPHSFLNEHVLFLSDGKRYLLTGSLYDAPWQFECRSLPEWDPEFVHYYVFEPVLLDLLKKIGVLVWHSAAVEKNGRAILLPGISGSGKSTTTLNLLTLGYGFLADDVALLRLRGDSVEVTGHDRELYVTRESLDLVPEWRAFRGGERVRKGRRWKYRVDLTAQRSTRPKPPVARTLLFPRVTRGRKTTLQLMSESEALLECLAQPPKEYPISPLGLMVLESHFDLYATLASSASCYRLLLGSDQEDVRNVLSTLHRRS